MTHHAGKRLRGDFHASQNLWRILFLRNRLDERRHVLHVVNVFRDRFRQATFLALFEAIRLIARDCAQHLRRTTYLLRDLRNRDRLRLRAFFRRRFFRVRHFRFVLSCQAPDCVLMQTRYAKQVSQVLIFVVNETFFVDQILFRGLVNGMEKIPSNFMVNGNQLQLMVNGPVVARQAACQELMVRMVNFS